MTLHETTDADADAWEGECATIRKQLDIARAALRRISDADFPIAGAIAENALRDCDDVE